MDDAGPHQTPPLGQWLAGTLTLLLGLSFGLIAHWPGLRAVAWLPSAALGGGLWGLYFGIAGLSLIAPRLWPSRVHNLQTSAGATLLTLAVIDLLYLGFRRGADLQIAELQQGFNGASAISTLSAVTIAVAFVLVGLILVLIRFRQDPTLAAIGRCSLIGLLLLATLGVLGNLLQWGSLYAGYSFDYLPLDAALGIALLCVGLWPTWRRDGATGLPQASDRGVTTIAVVVLVCTALGVGITTWISEQQQLAAVLGDGLRLALQSRIEQISTLVDLRIQRAQIIAERPALLKGLRSATLDPQHQAGANAIASLLHAFEPVGLTTAVVTLTDGTVIFRMGKPLAQSESRLALKRPNTELTRSNDFYLHSEMQLADAQGPVGKVVIDQVMPDLTSAFSKLDDRPRGDELLLCGAEGQFLRCFHSGSTESQSLRLTRNAAEWSELAAPALSGASGVSAIKDYRQRQTVGAYGPVGSSGLVAILKSDTAHLYGPLTEQFHRVLLFTLLLIGVGTGLIYLRVRPLANALKLGEQRLQLALDASASHVWDLDLRSNLLRPDASLFHLLGFEQHHTLNLEQWQSWLCPADLPKDPIAREGWSFLKQSSGAELRLRNAQGEYRWFNFRGGVVENDTSGRPVRALGTARDITERKHMEQELIAALIAAEDANHAKSLFLSSMSHELRTPLNGVLGYVQMLLSDPSTSSAQQRQLNAIESCGQHLLTLINDVLDLAKIESGTLEVESSDCNLYDLLESVSDIVRERAINKKLGYTVEIEKSVPAYIRTDAIKLRQILVNLLGNAIKFTSSGSVALRVGTRPTGRELLFQVSDTGIGIALEKQQEIFKPFRQASRSVGGTGLGLSISQRLCEALGGKLLVHSTVGAGSSFSFSLPFEVGEAIKAAPAQSLAHPIIDLRTASVTIMVVDDNPINRQVLAGMLRANGIDVVEAENGKDALEKLRIQPVPMVLMDVRMPVIDGFAATRAIKANPLQRHTCVIAVSASVFPDTIEGMRGAGCDDFIKKPVRVRELLEKVALHLQLPLRENDAEKESSGSV